MEQWHSLSFRVKGTVGLRQCNALIRRHLLPGVGDFAMFRLTLRRVFGKVGCDEVGRQLTEDDV